MQGRLPSVHFPLVLVLVGREVLAQRTGTERATDVRAPARRSHEGLEQHEKGQNAPASPFDAFFGGGGNRGVNRGPDAKVEMQVSLQQGQQSSRQEQQAHTPRVSVRSCTSS
jgi:hypothetical protein